MHRLKIWKLLVPILLLILANGSSAQQLADWTHEGGSGKDDPVMPSIPGEYERLIGYWTQVWPATGSQSLGDGIGGADDLDTGTDLPYPNSPLTSMTEVAELFSPLQPTTNLFLNFEGQTNVNMIDHIAPFETTTGDREKDIHEIMFHAAQTFAPFNVRVLRMPNDGQIADYGGSTTLFIGDKWKNNVWVEDNDGYYFKNHSRATAQADYPCLSRSLHHQPNSDPYNLGYVDPVSFEFSEDVVVQDWDSWENDQIARAIAHEAGHTFGLGHVLTNGIPDIMSYDAFNRRAKYAEFELTPENSSLGGDVSNNFELAPAWTYDQIIDFGETQEVAVQLLTQNSYRVLEATLGLRDTTGDLSNIASQQLVDGAYQDGLRLSITKDQMIPSEIEHHGDYDVVDFVAPTSEYIKVSALVPFEPSAFDPIVMVYNEYGNLLIAYDHDSGEGNDAEAVFKAVGGKSYQIVVGGFNNHSNGSYQLTVERAKFQTELPTGGDDIFDGR